jgi:hypothetical protein
MLKQKIFVCLCIFPLSGTDLMSSVKQESSATIKGVNRLFL